MTVAALAEILKVHTDLTDSINLETNGHGFSSPVQVDNDQEKNALYEGYFMRSFISFERTLEEVFLHLSCGGLSLAGALPDCRLTKCDKDTVRRILRQDAKYIDWANMDKVRARSSLFFVDGKPFIDPLISKSVELAEAQKIRNRISHKSLESQSSYDSVLVQILGTKPIFDMSPGQFLRLKRKKGPAVSLSAHYMAAMNDALFAVCEKP